MKSVPLKQDIKLLKSQTKKTAPTKKKKILEVQSPVRDTISETISFVIKGKLTPIKPILLEKKIVLDEKKNRNIVKKKTLKVRKVKEESAKAKSKVQTKTAKKTSAPNNLKKKNEKTEKDKRLKTESGGKIVKKNTVKEGKPKKIRKTVKIKKPVTKRQKKSTDVTDEDEIEKQKTIEQLLKQVNEEIKSKKCKHKSSKIKKKKEPEKTNIVEITITNKDDVLEQKQIKAELIETAEIKNEPVTKHKEATVQPSPKKKKYVKLKTSPKITVIKKRVPTKNKNKIDKQCKTKLFKFWNGPKRHRVASLNALAKVHCLYENESRGNILDIIDESDKLAYTKKDPTKNKITIKDEDISEDESPPPTRILRSVPGLRGVGKHWEMHETSSSDEDESAKLPFSIKVKKEKTQPKPKPQEAAPIEKKRKSNEIVMDLKDMVVRKRMASLNASAILAASYSAEKRHTKSRDSLDDSSSCTSNSSDEYFAAIDRDINIKEEEIDRKEEDSNLVEVHTSPNKKVAVILNQDTDVTITGVYVNSTTRSTHHEGYCSIAGMQYRISATSHTQTAATAVSTETVLQSSSSGPDNSNSDSMPSSKSYTPLDALSNMQPPPGPGIQHNHSVLHGQQPMGPPQHVLPLPTHPLSPGLRHSCSSAFSSPHSTPGYQIPPGHHPPMQGETGFVHAGYYQPAGPLITVPAPHNHGQPPPPPIPPLTKTVTLSEASPTSSVTPSLSSHEVPPPPPSSNGDSSDSEVIITSVTAAKDNIPSQVHPATYRYQYPGYPYPYPHPYPYPTQPPPPPNPPYSHHDICYSPNPYGHKWAFRRGTQYYPVPSAQEIYPIPPAGPSQPSQQMVTAPPVSASGTFSSPPNGPPPPPPTIMETFAGPQTATLIESYQPPPPHYYPSHAYGPPTPCYTHPPSRGIPYISAYQSSCPCPMQSCPKNVLTGPLTGESKRSSISSISKDSMPLPPVALALPLEPASATGPPSPARGSAGMPPPPSPAGATYQAPPMPTKQESPSPISEDDCKQDKKRKARIGKAMVRNNMMQQNTMLLMCNPSQNYVKREIESPKDTEVDQKRDISDEEAKPVAEQLQNVCEDLHRESQLPLPMELKEEKITEAPTEDCLLHDEDIREPLPPVINTVAENVKVKNMKRKLSMTSEKLSESEMTPIQRKKQKTGSYKFLIKRETSAIKINNGKRKLLGEILPSSKKRKTRVKLRRAMTKKEFLNQKQSSKRGKLSKPLSLNTANCRSRESRLSTDVKDKNHAPPKRVNSKSVKSAPAVLDKLFAKNNVERIIESVISDAHARTPRVEKCAKQHKDSAVTKTASKVGVAKKVKNDARRISTGRRKSKCSEAAIATIAKVVRRPVQIPKWSNGWMWEGEPFEAKVFLNSDELTVIRKCYPAMRHDSGDIITPRDCVLLKAGPRKNDLPFVAKIASLWENPDDGEMMMSLLWYYRPEHTEQGRLPVDQADEVFASRHKDSNSVACIDDKCYVLTFNEYCRYRKTSKRVESGIEEALPCIPNPEPYPRSHRQPPMTLVSPEMVFFCRRVYDFRQKRIMKNPT